MLESRRIVPNVLKCVLWRLAQIGLHVRVYYIIEENKEHVTHSPIDGVVIHGFNVEKKLDVKKLGFSVPNERRRLVEAWFRDQEPIYFALIDNEVAGFITISTKNIRIFGATIGDNRNDYYINYIYVPPPHRGHGIAGYLRSEAFRNMNKYRKGKCYSYVDYTNIQAVAASKKTGAKFLSLNMSIFTNSRKNKPMNFKLRCF